MKFRVLLALTASTLLAQNAPPHYAWTDDKVHEIRLTFKQPDFWARMVKNYLGTEVSAEYVDASLEWGPYKFDSVGVRFKGNSTYRVGTDKKPFRIKLNEFVKGQKIDGIAAYNLSNASMDASMVREPLYYEISRALGLKTPRTNFAALYINDKYWGLYVLGEVVNSDFLKNYFGSKEDTGNLYKSNIGGVFTYLGEDKTAYKEVWEKQTNEDADDWSDLIELCRLIGQTPSSELQAKLEAVMDIDSFLTAIALDNATVNLDSYVGMGQNFNVYKRPSDNKWVWIVWDPSLAFGAFGGGGAGGATAAQLATEYVQTAGGFGGGGAVPPGGGVPPPGGGGAAPGGGTAVVGRPLATKLWEIPAYKERYRQIYKRIVDNLLVSEKIVARANMLRAMIRPWVEQETQKLITMAQFDAAMTAAGGGVIPGQPGQGGQGGGGNAPGLQTFVEARVAWLKSQFANQSFPGARLTANSTALNFAAAVGTDPEAKTIDLTYTGVGTPPSYSVYTSTVNGGNWLKMTVTSGMLPGKATIAVDGKSLPAGAYEGTVEIYLGGAAPVVIPVNVTMGTVGTPLVSAIVNSASYAAGSIAPGSLVTLFGSNLGPAAVTTNSGGVKVTFDGVTAQVLYVSAGNVGAVAPVALAGKTQTSVRLTYGVQASAAVSKAVAPVAPGIFSINASGTGPGAVLNQNGTLNSAAAAAAKGSIVAIYLTGAGATNAAGTIAAATTVTIGGQTATVAFAGAAPGAVQGLYQVNATVPATAGSGAQPLVVSIGGVASQTGVTINVQ